MFTVSPLHFLGRKHDFFSRFTDPMVKELVNHARLIEMELKEIQSGARHGPIMTETLLSFLTIQRSLSRRPILTMSTASIARFHKSVVFDFIDGLKLESSSCRTLLKELSNGLEAICEKIASFLEWSFELLKKSPTKLFEVCLSVSLSLISSFIELGFWTITRYS